MGLRGGAAVKVTFEAQADDKSAFPSRCPECDAPWASLGGAIRTLVGHHSPPGHEHNDNCLSRSIWCANGHRNQVSRRSACPRCDWKGKATCWCHEFAKVDEWPDVHRDEGRITALED